MPDPYQIRTPALNSQAQPPRTGMPQVASAPQAPSQPVSAPQFMESSMSAARQAQNGAQAQDPGVVTSDSEAKRYGPSDRYNNMFQTYIAKLGGLSIKPGDGAYGGIFKDGRSMAQAQEDFNKQYYGAFPEEDYTGAYTKYRDFGRSGGSSLDRSSGGSFASESAIQSFLGSGASSASAGAQASDNSQPGWAMTQRDNQMAQAQAATPPAPTLQQNQQAVSNMGYETLTMPDGSKRIIDNNGKAIGQSSM